VRLPKLSSRQRITLRIVFALVLIWAIVGMISVRIVTASLSGRIDDELRSEAASGAAAIDLLPPELLEQIDNSDDVGVRQSALIVVGPDGVVSELPSGESDRRDPLPELSDRTVAELRGRAGTPFTVDAVSGDGRYRVATSPLSSGEVLVIARPLDALDEVKDLLGKVVTFGFLISAGSACLLVWVISRHALKPLEDVIVTAGNVEVDTLGSRIEVESTAAPDVERLATALNTMLDRLEEAFAAKDLSEARQRQFVSDASHELRTPLAAIIGYAELYQQRMVSSPQQIDHAMARIAAEAARMQTLVEGLLTLARLDEGRRLAADAVDLASIVDDAVAAVRAIESEHEFVVDVPDGQLEVTGDSVALRQIVDNLLTNVIAHTPEGTVAHVEASRRNGQTVLVVRDDGPGMDRADAEHVFDRFWRAEQSRSRPEEASRLGGSGLGLSIVAELARAHGGAAEIETAPGEGCTFTVRIPSA
jgi:two-component system OmpR family sensor kinase